MFVCMGGKLSSLVLKEFRDGADTIVSDRVFHLFTILCLKKFRRCLFVHLSFLIFLLSPLVFVCISSSSGIW